MASRAKPNTDRSPSKSQPPPGAPAPSAPVSDRADAATSPTVFDPLCSVFRRKLKAEGLKYTPERAQILDTVIRLGESKGTRSNGAGLFEVDRVLSEVRQGGFRVSKA